MSKVLNYAMQSLTAFTCVAVLTIVSAPVSSAADSGIEKLKWHDEPRIVPDTPFQDGEGDTIALSDFSGKVLVVNLWATWCAPCIREMPTLDSLQADLGGDAFHVIALSQDREGARVAKPFMVKNGWENLGLYVSDGTTFARAAKIRGLPTTLIIGADGREVARLEGTAEWNDPDIKDALSALIAKAD
jgi:thiol-disulfide isomerase/thioredoxin